ncbi:MAG: hypothetical protein NZ954_08460 [Thermofilaceae archaeon]|nr:hypothetical protein [Thermofilaceae archaeon]MDW8004946.1 hypothetical protein [Thermofilaceae archaeon]
MYALNIRLLGKTNRVKGKEYRLFYIHLPRKLINALGLREGDLLELRVVMHEGRQALLLAKKPDTILKDQHQGV